MSYPEVIAEAKKSHQKLQILYLDDCETDIESFKYRVNAFNKSEDNMFKNAARVQVATTMSHDDVLNRLVDKNNVEGFNVFVCDQNMPGRQGLGFITLLKKDVKVFYVLYSAGVNVDKSIREECARMGILFFDKIEDLSTLLEKLIMEVLKTPVKVTAPVQKNLSMEKLYYALANDIIEDMKRVEGTDFEIRDGNKVYKPEDIIRELTHKTEFAFEYVMDYLEGLKFFNKK
jgi:hypothetical protein